MSNSTSSKETNEPVDAVAIVGGTHGNELTGVHLIKHWQKLQRENNFLGDRYPSLQIEMLLANEPAIDANKRYLDKDLNRCFQLSELSDTTQNNQEQLLAKRINGLLGPKGEARVDFIVDLHTSTANMQTNIVLIKIDRFHLFLAAYLKSVLPNVVITSETRLMDDHHFLCSIAQKSIVIEVGPVPQGSLDWNIFVQSQAALMKTLAFVEAYNNNQLESLNLPNHLEVMSYFDKVNFPLDDTGAIEACVHPSLIHKDFSRISEGDPLFSKFSGEEILYEGKSAYIAFVNEAAYYDQKIALCLCNPIRYDLNTLAPVE